MAALVFGGIFYKSASEFVPLALLPRASGWLSGAADAEGAGEAAGASAPSGVPAGRNGHGNGHGHTHKDKGGAARAERGRTFLRLHPEM